MDVLRGVEGRSPVFRAALADIAQRGRPRSRALTELPGEGLKRRLRYSECLQAREGERDADPGVSKRAVTRACGGHHGGEVPHQPSARFALVDAQQEIGGDVGRRPWTEHAALDVL